MRFPTFNESLAIGLSCLMLNGCTAAANQSVDNLLEYDAQVARMSCGQLRKEWTRLENDTLTKLNPLGHWAARRDAVRQRAAKRGCRLAT